MTTVVYSWLKSISYKTVILSLLFFSIGVLTGKVLPSPEATQDVTTKHMGRIKYTNPLVDHPGINESNKEYLTKKKQIEKTIQEYLKTKSAQTISVYYQDLETNRWFSINETERYTPASLMKVTLLLAYLKLSEVRPALLQETIVNEGQYTDLANVPPAQRLAVNKTYTVQELLFNMIVHSNNEAQHLLSDYLDARVTPETRSRLVYETMTLIPASYEISDQYNLTVVDYAGIFRILYNATYLSESLSEQALALLAESSFDSGIVNGLPENVITANKFGFKENKQSPDSMQFHDCGIVYAEPTPYILCVMTKTDDPLKAQKIVSEISNQVYNLVLSPEQKETSF